MLAPDNTKPSGGAPAEKSVEKAPEAAKPSEAETLLAMALAEIAELKKSVAERPAQSELVDAYVLLTGLRYEGKDYAIDTVMPFDPTHPPKGCDGLEEGVHYTKAKRLR